MAALVFSQGVVAKTDTELVREFLERTKRIPRAEDRGELVGRSAGTIRRWIRETKDGGEVKPIGADARVAIEDFLAEREDVEPETAKRALRHIRQVARRALELSPEEFDAYLASVEAIMPIAKGGVEPDGDGT